MGKGVLYDCNTRCNLVSSAGNMADVENQQMNGA